jgi:hypothetical protein
MLVSLPCSFFFGFDVHFSCSNFSFVFFFSLLAFSADETETDKQAYKEKEGKQEQKPARQTKSHSRTIRSGFRLFSSLFDSSSEDDEVWNEMERETDAELRCSFQKTATDAS